MHADLTIGDGDAFVLIVSNLLIFSENIRLPNQELQEITKGYEG